MNASLLRRQLLLSTTMLVGAVTGYGSRAYGACNPAGGSTYVCSGANATTQTINANNAAVSTVAGFSVNTAAGNALEITGAGAISYTDINSSPLTAATTALYIRSTGNAGATPGSISVDTNGTLFGNYRGIDARNDGSGALSIVTEGDVASPGLAGGIAAINVGYPANGNVGSTTSYGIFAYNSGNGTALTITSASVAGIGAINVGTGAVTITARGDVASNTRYGIGAYNSGNGTDLSITSASVTGIVGIGACNYGTGTLTITTTGDVKGTGGFGIYAHAIRDIAITVNDHSTVTGTAGVVFLKGATNSLKNYGTITNVSGVNGIAIRAGAGSETVDNAGTITGAVYLDGGANAFNNLSGGLFNSGATVFLGAGNVLTNSATLSPGGAGAFLTTLLTGNFVQMGTGVFEVDVNAAGHSDRLVVQGTVNLTGSVLRVLAANGNYKPNTNYLIIDNDGSDPVVGTFASVTSNFAFLTPTVTYNAGDGNDVVLTLSRKPGPEPISFCSVADTRNQCNVALALDQFPTDNPLFLAVLTQTAEGARQAFDALSGEVHATLPGVLADESRYVREGVLGRLIQATYTNNAGQLAALGAGGPQVASLDTQAMSLGSADGPAYAAPPAYGPGLAFWTNAYGAWGDFDGNKNAATADRDLSGFVSGMDARVSGSWRLGLAAGYSQSDISVEARQSSADVESFHLAGYAGGMAGPLALRSGGAWAWNDIDTSRAVIFPGFFEREKTSYKADTGQIFGEVAYPMAMGGMALEPFAGIAGVKVDTDSFKEHGKLAALSSRGFDETVGYSIVGLRAAATMHWDGMIMTPHVSAAWQYAFDDVTPEAALAFASTGIGFDVTGVPLAQNSLLVEAGLDLNLSPTATLGASYSGQFADNLQDNAVKGRFTWLF